MAQVLEVRLSLQTPGAKLVQSGQAAQQCALAAAVGTADIHQIADVGGDVEIAEDAALGDHAGNTFGDQKRPCCHLPDASRQAALCNAGSAMRGLLRMPTGSGHRSRQANLPQDELRQRHLETVVRPATRVEWSLIQICRTHVAGIGRVNLASSILLGLLGLLGVLLGA